MKVAYLGAANLDRLAEAFPFDHPLPSLKRKYPFGSELAIGLVKAGHHVSVVVENYPAKELEVFHSPKCDVYVFPGRLYRYQFPTLYCKEVGLMRACIQKIAPDVVLANWTYQYARAAVTCGLPAVIIARDSPWRCARHMKTWSMWFKAFYAQLFVFPKIKNLVTISPHMVDDLRRLNLYRREVKVIPNGIRCDEGKASEGEKIIRREGKVIVCVSEWNKLKNTTTLMRAFATLRQRHTDCRLILVGNWMEDERGAGVWARQNLPSIEGIEFLGRRSQDEIRKLLRDDADVFCSPTLEESFGMVFLEAMVQGVPCVGGQSSGAVPWLLGDAGVMCDVRDPVQLAVCLEGLLKNFEKRKELSVCSIRRVQEVFSLEKTIKMYEEALEQVAVNK